MTLIKKIFPIALPAALVAALLATLVVLSEKPVLVHASGVSFSLCDTNSNTGTSSPYKSLVYTNGSTASSTVVCNTRNASSFDVNIQISATGTAPTLEFQILRSYDGITWYGEDTNSTSGNVITHSAGNAYHTWAPGTTATTTRNFTFATQHEPYVELQFEGVGFASSTVYAQIIPNNTVTN